jgi:hypothetical protein
MLMLMMTRGLMKFSGFLLDDLLVTWVLQGWGNQDQAGLALLFLREAFCRKSVKSALQFVIGTN